MANTTLYEYKDILWKWMDGNYGDQRYLSAICPVHKMELNYPSYSSIQGFCEDCKQYHHWGEGIEAIQNYLERKIASTELQSAEIISIDGIQTPQVKVRAKIPETNQDYWIEARINTSNKGKQIVIYAGEKGSSKKSQIFINADDEKLSFDHKDQKPEDVFTKITAEFSSGKKMDIIAPPKK